MHDLIFFWMEYHFVELSSNKKMVIEMLKSSLNGVRGSIDLRSSWLRKIASSGKWQS